MIARAIFMDKEHFTIGLCSIFRAFRRKTREMNLKSKQVRALLQQALKL
jgi:hypothetical protein